MPRIDSHVLYAELHPPEHLSPILTRNRFDGAILVGQASPPVDNLLGLLVPVDLDSPEVGRLLDQCQSQPKFAGVVCSLGGGLPQRLPELARRGIPLDLEIQPHHLALIERIADQVPRLAIDHMARPRFAAGVTTEWASGMEAAARFPNVYCKVSGLLSDPGNQPWSAASIRPFVEHVLAVFGTERVMFGSEWPACLPASTWKETLAAFTQSIGANSLDVRERLLGGNAQRFYGIIPSPSRSS